MDLFGFMPFERGVISIPPSTDEIDKITQATRVTHLRDRHTSSRISVRRPVSWVSWDGDDKFLSQSLFISSWRAKMQCSLLSMLALGF